MIRHYLKYLIASAEKNYLSNLYRTIKDHEFEVDTFLDVGCYAGDNTLEIAKACNAKTIYGIDIDKKALKKASKKGIRTIYQDINSKRWNVKSNEFDFVYSNQVIEHLSSVDNFMINIKRVLKKEGIALISTENLSGWHNCFALLLGYQPFSLTNICTMKWSVGNPLSITTNGSHNASMTHRAVFTYYALMQFLNVYNFEIIQPITAGYYPLPNNSIGNFMAKFDKRHSVYIAALVKNK